MSRSKLVLLIVLPLASAAVLAAIAIAQSRGTPTQPGESLLAPPIQTRQTSFSIPFQIDESVGATAPTEVQLFLSTDFGRTWKLADRAQPQTKSFSFRAPRDAMYWFSLRTVDVAGRIHPSGPHSIGLRVVVDTQPPTLNVSASRGNAGEVVIRWVASDKTLASDSLKMSYKSDPQSPWRTIVSAPPSKRPSADDSNRGSTIWWPNHLTGTIAIRATIADAAGNTTAAKAQIQLLPSDARQPQSDPTVALPSDLSSRFTSNHSPGNAKLPGDVLSQNTNTNAKTSPSSIRNGPSESWPVDKTSDVSMRRTLENNVRQSGQDRTALLPRESVVRRAVQSRVANVVPSSYKDLLPSGERPYMVRSTSFRLRYDSQSNRPLGTGMVQLWETRDGGKTWQKSGAGHDLPSPVIAKVPGPGLYGFCITVQNRQGQGDSPPRNGDLPEIWIGVDVDRPQVSIDQVRPIGSARRAELEILWHATDDHLATRPVTLLFASTAQGPWATLAAGLENTGSYRWRFSPRSSDPVYLRLEVRDTAGNVGVFQTARPVYRPGQSSRSRIQGVEPIESAAARPLVRRR